MQQTATHRLQPLQHAATQLTKTHYSQTMQQTATHRLQPLQHAATQLTKTHYNTLQHPSSPCNSLQSLQHTTMRYITRRGTTPTANSIWYWTNLLHHYEEPMAYILLCFIDNGEGEEWTQGLYNKCGSQRCHLLWSKGTWRGVMFTNDVSRNQRSVRRGWQI